MPLTSRPTSSHSPSNSEMELESELELDGFEAVAGVWEGEKLPAKLEADFSENTWLLTFVGIIARERRWRQRKPAGAP
jgi:hypothetical protein